MPLIKSIDKKEVSPAHPSWKKDISAIHLKMDLTWRTQNMTLTDVEKDT